MVTTDVSYRPTVSNIDKLNKLEEWSYQAEKKFDDLFIRFDTIHARERRKDIGRRPATCMHR